MSNVSFFKSSVLAVAVACAAVSGSVSAQVQNPTCPPAAVIKAQGSDAGHYRAFYRFSNGHVAAATQGFESTGRQWYLAVAVKELAQGADIASVAAEAVAKSTLSSALGTQDSDYSDWYVCYYQFSPATIAVVTSLSGQALTPSEIL